MTEKNGNGPRNRASVDTALTRPSRTRPGARPAPRSTGSAGESGKHGGRRSRKAPSRRWRRPWTQVSFTIPAETPGSSERSGPVQLAAPGLGQNAGPGAGREPRASRHAPGQPTNKPWEGTRAHKRSGKDDPEGGSFRDGRPGSSLGLLRPVRHGTQVPPAVPRRIAGLVAASCIRVAASIALGVSGAWPPSSE